MLTQRMKKKNLIPIDEARQLNAAGDRPIDRLDSHALERHLDNLHVFKLGLKNSLGIDFRIPLNNEATDSPSLLVNYLSEATPLARTRIKALPKTRRDVYSKLEDEALKSFWEVYYRFQPLLHQHAKRAGVEVDDLGNVLGRAILLYDKDQGVKFYSYLEKTLRESVKNLRGRVLADQYFLPLSAGRVLPQLFWILDQASFKLQRRLSPAESDELVVDYLRHHAAAFSESTMRLVAQVARTRSRTTSLDRTSTTGDHAPTSSLGSLLPAHDPSNPVDDQDEYEFALKKIHAAFERGHFSEREQAILLERLQLSHDEDLLRRIEHETTAGALRNKSQRLLIRFTAALHAEQARRFGRFLHSDPQAARSILIRVLGEFAESRSVTPQSLVQKLLNHMSLTDEVYRLSISERGRLDQFFATSSPSETKMAQHNTIDGHLFNKFKAALMHQDALDFTCLVDRPQSD